MKKVGVVVVLLLMVIGFSIFPSVTSAREQEMRQRHTINVSGIHIESRLNFSKHQVRNETALRVRLSNGEEQNITINPRVALIRAFFALNATDNFSIEINDTERNGTRRALFFAKAREHGRFLGIFRTRLNVQATIDPETGEVIESRRPWWSFLVTKDDKVDVCHVDSDNNSTVTINIAPPAVEAHINHGDTLGMCEEETGVPPENEMNETNETNGDNESNEDLS